MMTNGGSKPASPTAKLINGGNNSNIPLRRTLSRTNSSGSSRIPVNSSDKWRQKYEDVENKRKSILVEKEKANRQFNELQRKQADLLLKNEHLETELFEKNEEYTKLTIASKTLYTEYEMLKNQYDVETHAMSKALKEASGWYKENKQLKRKTMILLDKDMVDMVDEGVDECEPSGDSDIESLNKTIKQLSLEVAEAQTEVDSLKQIEFQTSEQNIKLMEELDWEKEKNTKLEREFSELKRQHEQIIRVAEMMKKELLEFKRNEEEQRTNTAILKKEANGYKKERNILAHQSTILLQGLDDEDNILMIQDIEHLKRSLEEERNKHEDEMANLQEKLDELENNPQVEVLEERLKLAESELQEALERAEKAENALKAPPAPPPPPPPPFLPPAQPPVVPMRKRRSRVNVLDLADTIGVTNDSAAPPTKCGTGVNEDIINAIKEGKFTLKKTKSDKKEREGTKAVSELLNILGNLRRSPRKRQSQVIAADVQL